MICNSGESRSGLAANRMRSGIGNESNQNADHEAHQIQSTRSEQRFVEIVDIEIDQAVVALVAAEILQMQIAAEPGCRRSCEYP